MHTFRKKSVGAISTYAEIVRCTDIEKLCVQNYFVIIN